MAQAERARRTDPCRSWGGGVVPRACGRGCCSGTPACWQSASSSCVVVCRLRAAAGRGFTTRDLFPHSGVQPGPGMPNDSWRFNTQSTTRVAWALLFAACTAAGVQGAADPEDIGTGRRGPQTRSGLWQVPCPGGTANNHTFPPNSYGACFTPDDTSVWVAFEPPFPEAPPNVSAAFAQCYGLGPQWQTDCPCCGDMIDVQTSNITAAGVTIRVTSIAMGAWGQGLRVKWQAPGPPAPPPPPSPPPTPPAPPHLAYMSFYGYNQSAQCHWTNLMWQELCVGVFTGHTL